MALRGLQSSSRSPDPVAVFDIPLKRPSRRPMASARLIRPILIARSGSLTERRPQVDPRRLRLAWSVSALRRESRSAPQDAVASLPAVARCWRE